MMNDTLNAKLRYTFICVSLAQYLTNKFFFFLHFHACRLTGNLFHSEKMPGLYTVVNVVKATFFYNAVYLVALSPQDMHCLNILCGSFSITFKKQNKALKTFRGSDTGSDANCMAYFVHSHDYKVAYWSFFSYGWFGYCKYFI